MVLVLPQARLILSTTSSQKWLAIELVPTILYSHAIRSLCYMSEVLSTTTLGLRTRICITGLALPLMLGSTALRYCYASLLQLEFRLSVNWINVLRCSEMFVK